MKRDDFDNMLIDFFATLRDINQTKGNDYSGSEDAFANFKRNAERLSTDKYQVWAVYFFKHLDSIETWLRERSLKSEPIEGRIDDAIMYLLLLKGMLAEDDETPVNMPQLSDIAKQRMDEIVNAYGYGQDKGHRNNHHIVTDAGRYELTNQGWIKTHG